jgi:hypothetical protein
MSDFNTFRKFVKDVMNTNDRELSSKDGETRHIAEECLEQWNKESGYMLDWTHISDLPVLGEVMLEHYLNVYNVCSGGVYSLNRMYTKIQELVIQDFVRLLWEVGTGERLEALAQFEGDWKV